MYPLMMDVSSYDARRWDAVTGKWICDRPTDWNKAATIGIQVAAIKISEGGLVYRNNRWEEGANEDPAFKIQWAAAVGRPRIAYHFFRSAVNAILQAQDLLAIWNSVPHAENDRLCIDFETQDGMSGNACLLAMDSCGCEITKATGQVPFLYTYPSFWLAIGGANATWAKKYPLFLAQWPLDNWIANTSIQLPPYAFSGATLTDLLAKIQDRRLVPLDGKPYNRMLSPWGSDIAAWQFTARAWTADIPGHPAIKKVCDLNVIYKPWWIDATTPPAVEPRRCPWCGQLWPENTPPVVVTPPVVISPVPAPLPNTYKVVIQTLNVRSSPDGSSDLNKLGVLSFGARVVMDYVSGSWLHFVPQAGFPAGGFVWLGYLQKV